MGDIVLKELIAFALGAVSSFVGAIIAFAKTKKHKQQAIEQGLQALLRAELIHAYDKYEEQKYIPIYAREATVRMYKAYHELGGNDVVTDLYKQTLKLPTEPKE